MSLMRVVATGGADFEIKVESRSDFDGSPIVGPPFDDIVMTVRCSDSRDGAGLIRIPLVLNYDQALVLATALLDLREG